MAVSKETKTKATSKVKATKLSKDNIIELRRLYNEEGYSVVALCKQYSITPREALELANDFTEKEVYKLYYAGLTPRFIALKIGVGETIILDWFEYKNKEDGYVQFSRPTYHYQKQKEDLLAKGKKACNRKDEQVAKNMKDLADEFNKALKKVKKDGILDKDSLEAIGTKLGYKNMKHFKKALQLVGVYTDELDGIFNKMEFKPERNNLAVRAFNKKAREHKYK